MSKHPNTTRSATLPGAVVVGGLTFCALWLVVFSIRDYDTFWHLANGRAMLEQGRIINEEIFSYSATGTRFANHSWLAQIIMYLFFAAGGAVGLIVFKLLLTAAILFCLYRSCRLFGAAPWLAGLFAYAAVLVGLTRYVARPQIFSYLALALLGWLLYGYLHGRFSRRVLWALPLLMLTWDFMHGAVFGYLFWGALAAAESIKRLLPRALAHWQAPFRHESRLVGRLWLWLGVSFVLSLLRPWGFELYRSLFAITGDDFVVAMTGEFMATGFTRVFLPFWILLGIAGLVCLLTWRHLDLTFVFVILPFAYLGMRYNRCVAAFAIAALPILAAQLRYLPQALRRVADFAVVRRGFPAIALAGVVILTFVLKGPPLAACALDPTGMRTSWGINRGYLPLGAVEFVETADLQGNMFNSDRFGGLLAYYLYPERRIFHYNHPRIFREIYGYLHNPAARDRWQHNYAIVAKPIEVALFRGQGWVPVYRDPAAMVMVPINARNAAIIRRYRVRYFDPLMPSRDVRELLQQPAVAAALADEIANYLRFNCDPRFSALLVEALSSRQPDMPAAAKMKYARRALRGNPRSADLLGFVGLQHYRSGQLEQARKTLEKAMAEDETSSFVLLNLGFVYLDLGKYEQAEDVFRRLQATAADNVNLFYGLGAALSGMNRQEAAAEWLRRYLESAPRGRFSEQARQLLRQ